MSLFKKPSELEPKPGLSMLIYGQPGCGKSTVACSAPNAVLIDTDGGVMRINGAHQVPTLQVKRWEDITAAMQEVRNDPHIESVIFDTVGKMIEFMTEYIVRTDTGKRVNVDRNGRLSLKGFGTRKVMFKDFVSSLTTLGKNVIFVAHEKEEKRGEEMVLRPEVGGSSAADLMKELDLVGYMEMIGDIRTINFNPTERFYAKNTCDMPEAKALVNLFLPNENGDLPENNFLCTVISNYHNRALKSRELNRQYEDLKELIEANISDITDAESAERFIEWQKGVQPIYNSKIYARRLFNARLEALGLKLDKSKKVVNV